jgi:hypothetical protein
MKKFDITVSLGIIIITAGLLILLGLRSRDSFEPSYRFLGGRNPITCEKAKTGNEDKRYIYSFEADFNDVCSNAEAELIPEGFVGNTVVDKIFSDNLSPFRVYYLKGRFPRGPIWIYIYKNRQCIKLPNSNDYAIADKDGWVEVEIVYGRGWQWPF